MAFASSVPCCLAAVRLCVCSHALPGLLLCRRVSHPAVRTIDSMRIRACRVSEPMSMSDSIFFAIRFLHMQLHSGPTYPLFEWPFSTNHLSAFAFNSPIFRTFRPRCSPRQHALSIRPGSYWPYTHFDFYQALLANHFRPFSGIFNSSPTSSTEAPNWLRSIHRS